MIRDVCEQTGHHKKDVYRYLKQYWVGGKVINALLPLYHNCGAAGKERQATEGVKRGRPRRVAREDPSLIGINITYVDRKKIKIATKRWYLSKEKNTLTFTYHEMLREMYNTGFYIARA